MIHLRTQDNQPYGSMRRCCEICGVMIWPERFGVERTPAWTDDRAAFASAATRCSAKPS